MRTIVLSALLFTTLTFSQSCTEDYQIIKGKKMMSDCRWSQYIKNEKPKKVITFHKTIHNESGGKYDAVNLNDLGKPAYGYIQFRGKYAKTLERQLRFTRHTPLHIIKRKLRSKKGVKLQQKLFRKQFIEPILAFANKKGITNKKVLEILVDWKVNGMPRRYYKQINRFSTVKDIINLRKRYYKHLHRKNPRRYTKRLYLAWINRLVKFT